MKEKKIEKWTIMIPYSSDPETTEEYKNVFICNLGGMVTTPKIHMHIVAYCDEWKTLIETTKVVKFRCSNTHAYFTTYSGSLYVGRLDDFKGFRRRTPDNELEDIEPPDWWPKSTR